MTLAKSKAKTKETFIVQGSLTIVTYDHKNMFIVQHTGQMRNYICPWQVFLAQSNICQQGLEPTVGGSPRKMLHLGAGSYHNPQIFY